MYRLRRTAQARTAYGVGLNRIIDHLALASIRVSAPTGVQYIQMSSYYDADSAA